MKDFGIFSCVTCARPVVKSRRRKIAQTGPRNGPKVEPWVGRQNKGLSFGAKMTTTKTIDATTNDSTIESTNPGRLPAYQKPTIRVMDEKDVLSAFQVTVAGISWWG